MNEFNESRGRGEREQKGKKRLVIESPPKKESDGSNGEQKNVDGHG